MSFGLSRFLRCKIKFSRIFHNFICKMRKIWRFLRISPKFSCLFQAMKWQCESFFFNGALGWHCLPTSLMHVFVPSLSFPVHFPSPLWKKLSHIFFQLIHKIGIKALRHSLYNVEKNWCPTHHSKKIFTNTLSNSGSTIYHD